MNAEEAISEAAAIAKEILVDADGKPRGIEWYLKLSTLDFLFRPARLAGPTREGLDYVSWRDKLYVYDATWAEVFIEAAKDGDWFSDRIVRNAAGLLLEATNGISDARLRTYACNALSGDYPQIDVDARKTRNMFRDRVIWQYLILPLVQKKIAPTRNETTDSESACSVVSKALQRVGIDLGERRLAEIWHGVAPALQKINVKRKQ